MPQYLTDNFPGLRDSIRKTVADTIKPKLESGAYRPVLEAWISSPRSHPCFEIYRQICSQVGGAVADSAFINNSWDTIIKMMCKKYFYLHETPQPSFPQAEFDTLSQMVADAKVMVPPPNRQAGAEYGLWSGGIGMSRYARNEGIVTLEATPMGSIIDGLTHDNLLWPGWGANGIIWNALSAAYVKAVANLGVRRIHVFVRTYTPASVLYREEQKNWRSALTGTPVAALTQAFQQNKRAYLQEADGMIWHPFTGPDNALEPVPGGPFDTAWSAHEALTKTYVRKYKNAFQAELQAYLSQQSTDAVKAQWSNLKRGFKQTFASMGADFADAHTEGALVEFQNLVRYA